MVSLWCASLSTNTRFCFILEWTIVKSTHVMSQKKKKKKLLNSLGRLLSNNELTDKTKWLLIRSSAFLHLWFWTECLPIPSFIAPGLEMAINFQLVGMYIFSIHSTLKFAHHFVIHWLLESGTSSSVVAWKRIHTRSHTKEKLCIINSEGNLWPSAKEKDSPIVNHGTCWTWTALWGWPGNSKFNT